MLNMIRIHTLLRLAILTCGMAFSLTGCQQGELSSLADSQGKGVLRMGGMAISAEAVNATTRTASTFDAPEASALSYKLTNLLTNLIETPTYEELTAAGGYNLPVGEYELEVSYGENVMSEVPYLYYKHPDRITIQPEATTVVGAVTVPLASSIVQVHLSDGFGAQFPGGFTLSLSQEDVNAAPLTLTADKDYFLPAGASYTLTLSGTNAAGIDKQLTLYTISQAQARLRYRVNCSATLPVLTLPAQSEANAWGSKLVITPLSAANVGNVSSEADIKAILGKVDYEIFKDGAWVKLTDKTNYTFTGLTGSTPYRVRANFNGIVSNEVTITTEAQAGVPNGDFEEVVQTINIPSINQGGSYKVSPSSYQNTCSFTISEPKSWSSINAKTCNQQAGNQNSWFVVPSSYGTNLSWSSTRDIWSKTSTPDVYSNLSAQHGNIAMIIRNVSWDQNGTTPSQTGGAFNTTYYNEKVPNTANTSSGKLFLGSYSYTNGVETYNEGTPFASRPTALKGFFKYANDTNDTAETGTIKVTLLNGNTVIAEGSCNFNAQSTYKEFTANLEYKDKTQKATTLKIMIASSSHASYKQADETASIKTTVYNGVWEAVKRGATLTIDNLTFTY